MLLRLFSERIVDQRQYEENTDKYDLKRRVNIEDLHAIFQYRNGRRTHDGPDGVSSLALGKGGPSYHDCNNGLELQAKPTRGCAEFILDVMISAPTP